MRRNCDIIIQFSTYLVQIILIDGDGKVEQDLEHLARELHIIGGQGALMFVLGGPQQQVQHLDEIREAVEVVDHAWPCVGHQRRQ